jgi:transposase
MKETFLEMNQAAESWCFRGCIPPDEQLSWEATFWRLLQFGETLNPPLPGRPRTATQKLLRSLRRYASEVLTFLRDPAIPFTNNQAERDLRMFKVHQKVAGCCRTEDGSTALCRWLSVISCLRKQGRDVLAGIADAISNRPLSLLSTSV